MVDNCFLCDKPGPCRLVFFGVDLIRGSGFILPQNMGYLILYNHALGRLEKAGNLEFHGETNFSYPRRHSSMFLWVPYFVEAIGLFSVVTSQFNWVCCIVYVYSYLG